MTVKKEHSCTLAGSGDLEGENTIVFKLEHYSFYHEKLQFVVSYNVSGGDAGYADSWSSKGSILEGWSIDRFIFLGNHKKSTFRLQKIVYICEDKM